MANYGTRYVKKKTPWAAFAFLLLFFLLLGYIISGLYVAPANLKGDYNAQMLWAVTHFFKIANSKTPAWVGIGFIGWFFFVNYYMIHYRNFHSEMEHGDEDWLDPVKASRELMDSDDKYNRILSENVKVSIRGKLSNNNMMIIGSSGSFKTTSIMHQNLLQMGSSYVVFIMPTAAFDSFRTSWFECSSCRNPLFEKQIMSKIPHICPHCGVHLENIICDEQAFHILYKTGKIVNVNKEFTRNE